MDSRLVSPDQSSIFSEKMLHQERRVIPKPSDFEKTMAMMDTSFDTLIPNGVPDLPNNESYHALSPWQSKNLSSFDN
jgi:hypothetical protein